MENELALQGRLLAIELMLSAAFARMGEADPEVKILPQIHEALAGFIDRGLEASAEEGGIDPQVFETMRGPAIKSLDAVFLRANSILKRQLGR